MFPLSLMFPLSKLISVSRWTSVDPNDLRCSYEFPLILLISVDPIDSCTKQATKAAQLTHTLLSSPDFLPTSKLRSSHTTWISPLFSPRKEAAHFTHTYLYTVKISHSQVAQLLRTVRNPTGISTAQKSAYAHRFHHCTEAAHTER